MAESTTPMVVADQTDDERINKGHQMNRRSFVASSVGLAIVTPSWAAPSEPFVGKFERRGRNVESSWSTEVNLPAPKIAQRFTAWMAAARLIKDAIEIEVRRKDDTSADVYFERELSPLLPNINVLIRMKVVKSEPKRAELLWTLIEGTPKSLRRHWTIETVDGESAWTRVSSHTEIVLPFSPPSFIEMDPTTFLSEDIARLKAFLSAPSVRRPLPMPSKR